MFIRVKSTPNSPRKSIQIVESKRVGDKIRQRIVRHVGVAMDDDELERMKDLGAYIIVKLQKEQKPSLFPVESTAEAIIAARMKKEDDKKLAVDLKKLREESRITVGFHEVYGDIYDQLGFGTLLSGSRLTKARGILRDVVLARLARPVSKLATVKMLDHDFGIEADINKVYRMMDKIDNKVIERISHIASRAALGVLADAVDIVFYDCTTLYFESFDEDELREKGLSKENKTAETQVLMALMVTQEGLPLGYKVS